MNIKEINFSINLDDLLGSSVPAFVVDKDKMIVWSNYSFEKIYGQKLLGNKLSSALDINFTKISIDKTYQEIRLDKYSSLRISKILLNGNEPGFLLELISDYLENHVDIISQLLSSLNLEESIDKFCNSVLSAIDYFIEPDKSFIVLFDNNQIKEIFTKNVRNETLDLNEFKKILTSIFPALKKWFDIYKNMLISKNEISSLAYQINQFIESEFLIIAPSYFEDRIFALTIISTKNKVLNKTELEVIKAFSNILCLGVALNMTNHNLKAIEIKLANSQKLETVGKLASGLAHDFNNLLASIFGSINLLKTRIGDNQNALKLIDNIESCSIRARDLTKGILSFGKPTPQRKEIIFLDSVLNELSKIIKETFPKSIKISFEVDDSLYKVVGNSTEIYQVLLNLCINAKEAITNEGTITVKAENIVIDDSNIFLFPFLEKGHYVKISVSDTGVGIEEENLSKIFEPYFSTKQKDTGSGLGLFVTSQLIKEMNGYIDVESKVNVGTTFRIYLPAVMIKEQSVISTKDKIIMLADDEEMLNELLGDLLESNGFYVLKVNNTKEVFRILSEEVKVDLLIIDYNLPEITGLECVTKLRETGFDKPVILASGATNFNSEEISKARIDYTLQKPYEFETILDTIKKLL